MEVNVDLPLPTREGLNAEDLSVGDLIEVLWDDAACWYKESVEDDWIDDQNVLTFGVIVKLTERSVFLASEVQLDNGTYRGVTRIPWTYILGLNVLRTADA